MTYRYFRSTALTTNFDKLLEDAFTRQGAVECQPIRTDSELQFWDNVHNRYYVLKLHGDYDTQNISNTPDETVSISDNFRDDVSRLLEYAGLLVLGTAGQEKSIHTLFDELAKKAETGKVLRFGLLWGIYVGSVRPDEVSQKKIETLINEQLETASVSSDIKRMIERVQNKEGLFYFFPIWGAADFMYRLVAATRNRQLIGTAQRYLDRDMRLRAAFSRSGLSKETIDKHLKTLTGKRTHRTTESERQVPEQACSAVDSVNLKSAYSTATLPAALLWGHRNSDRNGGP
jgi:hypothetical protein